ncbi:ribulokinase [Rubinisphaera margarita]|uniref:ribulokinase n=1 Tax=Rubinisphaera margarita TaxID=2909586 RepID=UPI001EE8C4F5|nr:ribulokinase [Rubinisphaera margarita]MCG6155736.1 ribulokinase [Rubinisphaera margarita]
MADRQKVSLGLDFGTLSVRALLVSLDGTELASEVVNYEHGQLIETLPGTGEKLPAEFALQHPQDWIDSAAEAVKKAVQKSGVAAEQIIGIGVDFTSCTMLPAAADGRPLCLLPEFAGEKYAWPKLWKHHAAQPETDRLNEVARERNESWLARYGGIIGLEWFFPKILETLTHAPHVYDATEVWLEAGDWFVWQLVGGEANSLPRSTCQAGYKAMWHAEEGFPSSEYFEAVDSRMANVVDKMPGRFCPPGSKAGTLTDAMAERLGLQAGIAVSAAIIDAHSGVPGVGAYESGTLVLVMGTSSCHMLNSEQDQFVPGVAGIVKDGILPGYFGYETGQAAVGDSFDWIRRLTGQDDFKTLDAEAKQLAPGSEGVRCLDWFAGCRTPLMDGSLSGQFQGLKLYHGPAHLYRATLEASAFGVRWIVDLLREHDVPVNRFIATGGLPHHNRLLVQIYADVLGSPIEIHPSQQGPALGAAILGAFAAQEESGFADIGTAIQQMAHRPDQMIVMQPDEDARAAYEPIFQEYRREAARLSGKQL